MDNEKHNVFKTYDIIANWFSKNRNTVLMERAYLDQLIDIVGSDASVLDLGCGTGMPMMSYLINRGIQTTGVDASERMLEIAKNNLPQTVLIKADMRELALDRKFDAIIAWHSFFHLPAEDQPAMFRIFKDHLKENGVLLFTSGKEYGESWGINGGKNLFHASLNRDQYHSLLEAHDFRVLIYKEDDPECGEATVWMAQLNPYK